jgi:hypothetical protein
MNHIFGVRTRQDAIISLGEVCCILRFLVFLMSRNSLHGMPHDDLPVTHLVLLAILRSRRVVSLYFRTLATWCAWMVAGSPRLPRLLAPGCPDAHQRASARKVLRAEFVEMTAERRGSAR